MGLLASSNATGLHLYHRKGAKDSNSWVRAQPTSNPSTWIISIEYLFYNDFDVELIHLNVVSFFLENFMQCFGYLILQMGVAKLHLQALLAMIDDAVWGLEFGASLSTRFSCLLVGFGGAAFVSSVVW